MHEPLDVFLSLEKTAEPSPAFAYEATVFPGLLLPEHPSWRRKESQLGLQVLQFWYCGSPLVQYDFALLAHDVHEMQSILQTQG